MQTIRTLAIAFAITVELAVPINPGRADVPTFVGNSVVIEDAVISAGKKGERSVVRFRLVNDSHAAVHLMGVETDTAESAELVARIGDLETTTLESIGAGSGEVLDLTTSHLWYELGPLTRDLSVGETITMRVHLAGASLSVPLHVHE